MTQRNPLPFPEEHIAEQVLKSMRTFSVCHGMEFIWTLDRVCKTEKNKNNSIANPFIREIIIKVLFTNMILHWKMFNVFQKTFFR